MARSYRQLAINRRVMVNLTSGDAVEGILWSQRGALIVLRDAALHSDGGSSSLDGEVIVERDRISFVQVLP